MLAPARLVALAVLAASTPALADGETVTTEVDTLVVITPNAPVVVTNGGAAAPSAAPGASADAVDIEMPPVAVRPTPQGMYNEPWSNVSHINGSLVPVGERTSYLKKTFSTSISTNPIAWMVGIYGVSVSRAVHTNIALRGDVNIFSGMFGSDTNGYELSATAPIYLRRVFSGPFVEPGLLIRHTEDSYDSYGDCFDCSSYDSSSTLVGPQVMFGWHWIFDSGLHASVAFGLAKNMSGPKMDDYGYSYDNDEPEPTGYFRVGYAWE